ncbi:MAG TPA: hypothetical protein H9996_06800 [Candidatus Faecalibacterium avium]|nr:hypothetical protein [Candidatus Faecalibacterium avium]
MQVKKCMALFVSAAFAMLTLAGCGGSDHSELAARTVNEAQKEPISVEFITDRDLTQSLKDALKDTTDPSELINAIQADADLTDLLTGAQIDVYTAGSQLSPEEAAQQIAERILTNLSGKQDKGYITMVETEDGTYYAIALFYRTGSGSGNGSGGSSDDDNTGGSTDPENPGGGEAVIVYNYTINSNSDVKIEPSVGTIGDGSDLSFTVTPDTTEKVVRVTVNGKDLNVKPGNVGEKFEYTLEWKDIIPEYEYDGEKYTYTVNIEVTVATVSEYGESQYLTQEDFTAIEEELGYFAESEGCILGNDPDIQNTVKNIDTAYSELIKKYEVRPYRCSGNSLNEILYNIENNIIVSRYETYDTVYMGIRDGENGEIECMVYLLKTKKTL